MDILPVYTCRRAPGAIVVDGRLDEASWTAAEAMPLVLADTGAAPRQPTTARLLWDNEYLYVAYECQDDDIWGTTTERDREIFKQEVVEVFVDAASCGTAYVEIEVSPLNAVLDLFILWRDDRRRGLWDWNSAALQTAVVVDGDPWRRGTQDRRWTVEIAIPMLDFEMAPHVPPEPGDTWRINLYRIDRGIHGDEYTAWSPPGRLNYHTPSRFGILSFAD